MLVLGSALAWPALAADPAAAALERGRKLSTFCANCHGPNGNSTIPEVPNLAGQNADYLVEQMARFADGRRTNEFMQGLIKAMSVTERSDVVNYYARQTVAAKPPGAADIVARGKFIYERNCFRCHGNEALGTAKIPRVAGQQVPYMTQAIKRYRDRTGERIEPIMAEATKLLTDADIAALAAYVSTMN